MTGSKEWREMFRAWKALHPELTKAYHNGAARGCAGKIQHRTLEAAQLVADIANAKQGPLNSPIRAYECPVCAMFHIGHTNMDGYGPDGKIA